MVLIPVRAVSVGSHYVAITCPWCGDRRSLSMSRRTNRFYCFTCKKRGAANLDQEGLWMLEQE